MSPDLEDATTRSNFLPRGDPDDPQAAPGDSAAGAAEIRDANQRLLVAGLAAQEEAETQTALAAAFRDLAGALEESELRYRRRAAELQATIDGLADGIAVIDGTGNVAVSNEALALMLGHSISTEADLRSVLEGAALQPPSEPTVHHLELNKRWLEVRVSRVPIHDTVQAASRVVTIRDVTHQRALDRMRDAFVGVLSHELRTPVTTILGMSELLERSTDLLVETTRRELIRDVAREAERLNRLVEDLVVLSRAERGRLDFDPEPVLVQHMIREAIAAEAGRYPQVRFASRTPSLPAVSADPTYVRQILSNLLSNAGKYGGSEVLVVADQAGDEVLVRVLDSGPSFSVAEGEQLFDLFFRTDTSMRRQPGAGIGLFVARALAEAMGGRVWAAQREQGGSDFGFALPVCR